MPESSEQHQTRVDFYEMTGRFTDPLDVACVLVGKAWPAIDDIVLVAPRDRLGELDRRLWEKPAGRFLPHAIDETAAPIRLSERSPERAALLINLDTGAALPAGEFDRVLEIVPPEEPARQRLRQRWIDWKQRGAGLHHHVLK